MKRPEVVMKLLVAIGAAFWISPAEKWHGAPETHWESRSLAQRVSYASWQIDRVKQAARARATTTIAERS